ncbi:MAG: hypothetical protein LBM09_02725 [Candidatus Nomurabacteria bacterium]|jgi:hypothetical protein|nr:hypothetical protein [Candidatus Nomurabacteria bacterium]
MEENSTQEPTKVKNSNSWKMTGIILIIVSVILVAATVLLAVGYNDQKSQIDELKNKVQQVEKDSTTNSDDNTDDDSDSAQSDDDTKLSTYTTEKSKLSFTYPSKWSVEGEIDEMEEHYYEGGIDLFSETATITTTEGYKLKLSVYNGGGIGGACDKADEAFLQIHKEADGNLDGSAVISYVDTYNGRFDLVLSNLYTGPFDEPVGYCSSGIGSSAIGYVRIDNDNLDIAFGNGAKQTDRPSNSEYADIVKVLSSLTK